MQKDRIMQAIAAAIDLKELINIEKEYLSREHGKITLELQTLGKLPPEERRAKGAELNELKQFILKNIDEQKIIIEEKEIENKINNERIDVTAPANYSLWVEKSGCANPITQTINELREILHEEKFAIFDGGYDIENDYFNFTALNTHKLHPARQTQDTIYIDGKDLEHTIENHPEYFGTKVEGEKFLLRTHTSPQQIRIAREIIKQMDSNLQSFKFATLGRSYRNESDSTHSPMFHQMEIVSISENIYAQDLLEIMMTVLSKFFDIPRDKLQTKLRSSYFPFTNPSWEIDLYLPSKQQWVEILGAGMVHPDVIKNMGLDNTKYRGYALGAGIERLCMLKHNISDLRSFFSSNIDLLQSYSS